jgi:hypothetical protein
MSSYTYTGTLTDIGLGVLAGSSPVMRVRPAVEAFGPDGIVSAVPVPVAVDPGSGVFSMLLYPSGELRPAMGGAVGVDYVIEVGRFEGTIDGLVFSSIDVWKFTAAAGGGNVGEMAGGSLLAVWVGPPWPPAPLPAGLYIDITPPNAFGIVS